MGWRWRHGHARGSLMGRPAYGARTTCKSCKSIDVRRWHREGLLSAGQYFTCSWTHSSGERSGSINVSTERDAVVLTYQTRHSRLPSGNQSVSECRSSGPTATSADDVPGSSVRWFATADTAGAGSRCSTTCGSYFACRRCYGLAYASQQESLRERGLLKAQKILIRLGAKPDLFELFPEKPPRMHWRTYERLRRVYEIARDRSIQGVLGRVPRVERDLRYGP